MNQHTETENLRSSSAIPPPSPASVPTSYGSIETNYVPPNNSWYEDFKRNRPQSTSLSAASLIFLSNGMSLAFSVGITTIKDYGTYIQSCWFIAIIIGACISAILAHRLTKCSFNIAASVLVIAKGILYIAFPAHTTWIILARYFDGIAFGLTIIPTILAGSEQSARNFRGYVLGVEQTSLSVGAMLLTLFAKIWNTSEDINRAHGYASLAYGLFALLDSFVFTIESPIFHLRKNNETEALNVLRQLQSPKTITNETHALLNENKELLEDDVARGLANNISNSWMPMITITFLRIFVSLSFSLPLTWLFIFTKTFVDLDMEPNPFFFFMLFKQPKPFFYVLTRVIGVTISLMIIDRVGRRTLGAVVLLIGSIFLLGIGTLTNFSATATMDDLRAIIVCLIFQQLLAGIVAPTSTCYLGEAYSISVKPYFILVSVIVENIIQILVTTHSTFDSFHNFALTLAALQFIYAFVHYFTLPETKGTSLREALNKFSNRVYVRFENA